ncbi:hypothetical protein Zmor_019768 [Zophobas morio]|uniref:Gustatory receptor n=1 Tax=Zophobas morio TaxID=2755281 RepID=A0AA38I429_9CUCU|nr:hypothetical protein Zmor_019768 [Zophobas morio]
MKIHREPKQDIQSLRALCSYLDFILVTPWYDFNKNTAYKPTMKKIYGCFFIAAKLTWWSFTIKYSIETYDRYRNSLLSQKLGFILIVSTATIQCFLTIITSTFCGIKHWKTLFTNVEIFDSRINIREKMKMTPSKQLIRSSIFQQAISLVLCLYVLYVSVVMLRTPLWKSLCLTMPLELLSEMWTLLLMNVINDVIKRRYQILNIKLVEVLRGVKVVQELENVVECYQILAETVEAFNRIFSYPMLLFIFQSGVQLIHCLNFRFVNSATGGPTYYLTYLSNVFCLFVGSVCLLLSSRNSFLHQVCL